MLGGDKNAQLQMYLEKIMDLFAGLPDKEDLADGGKDEAAEGEPPIGKGEADLIIGIGEPKKKF